MSMSKLAHCRVLAATQAALQLRTQPPDMACMSHTAVGPCRAMHYRQLVAVAGGCGVLLQCYNVPGLPVVQLLLQPLCACVRSAAIAAGWCPGCYRHPRDCLHCPTVSPIYTDVCCDSHKTKVTCASLGCICSVSDMQRQNV